MKIIVKRRGPKPPEPHESGQHVPITGYGGFFLAVDPGINGTGWAVFEKGPKFNQKAAPVASGSIEPPDHKEDWSSRAIEIIRELEFRIKEWRIAMVYIEQPQFFEGGKGLPAARDGDLVSLSMLTGMILGYLYANVGCIPCPIPVHTWKGSLPKSVCNNRVLLKMKALGWKPVTNTTHELDAVGLGLFAKGQFQ
jgi:hypothetical protein